ncbi:MAG: anti-sigma factor [Casimicrobiaceae bacterium]
MIPTDPAERSATAAEYVIGTLPDAERTEFEQALAHDAGLRRDVYFWQDKLLPVTDRLVPVEPSATLWPRIAAGIAPKVTPSPGTAGKLPWWSALHFWRFSALAATLVAVVLAVRLLEPGFLGPPAARYVAVLQSPDKRDAGWIVEASMGGKLRLIPLGTTMVPQERALQFWTKAQSASAPTSLGLVPANQPTEIDAARLPTLEADQLFELTLEPATGSPTGRPTGPVLFVGRTTLAMNTR